MVVSYVFITENKGNAERLKSGYKIAKIRPYPGQYPVAIIRTSVPGQLSVPPLILWQWLPIAPLLDHDLHVPCFAVLPSVGVMCRNVINTTHIPEIYSLRASKCGIKHQNSQAYSGYLCCKNAQH